MLLADLGADVTKVEPLGGDPFRAFGAAFIGVNRGKRALTIDLKKDGGLRTFYDMVRQADIVADNFRGGVTRRLKVDYETLSAVNPRIICCSVTPYGPTGPLSDLPGYDPVIGARSGMQRAQGGYGKDDEPVYHNTAIVDFTSALMATYGMCAALLHREKTGRGQLVETCLANNAMVAQVAEFLRYEGRPPVLAGGRDIQGTSAAYRIYQCGEGEWLFLGATTVEQADAILAVTSGASARGGADLWFALGRRRRSPRVLRPAIEAKCWSASRRRAFLAAPALRSRSFSRTRIWRPTTSGGGRRTVCWAPFSRSGPSSSGESTA
jgi:crotonobetainyl-CoA:carnitine CoA-transferase CaiB-like acyl-CoA transferase